MRQLISSVAIMALICNVGMAEEKEVLRTITVSGQGKASAPPDMATIQSGVTSLSATAQQALADNSRAMENVINLLKSRNVAEKDIQTSGFSVYPEYRRQQRGAAPAENQIAGYRVSNNVVVKVRQLAQLGQMLDALVQAGSNQISGVTFGIAEPTAIADKARLDAMQDAARRAQLYAEAAGLRVGKIISISEQSIRPPMPMAGARMAFAANESVPIARGEQEVGASINVMYELSE